jgi:hypothetical protein
MDFDFLSSLHPLVAILAWDVLAGGIDANTRILAEEVKRMGLDESEMAGIISGANLGQITAVEDLCKEEIEELRKKYHERHNDIRTDKPPE